MKKIHVIVLMLFTALSYAQVGINIATPHTSSALDVTSTSAGFLPPRMTALQRAEIVNPALGLMVFCTNCASGDGELQVNYASGWKNAAGGDITDPPPQIGDYRDGGIVFYIASPPVDLDGDGDLDTGLVCAIQDQNSNRMDTRRQYANNCKWRYISFYWTRANKYNCDDESSWLYRRCC